MPFRSIDPFRGELHESFPELDSHGLDLALAQAGRAAGLWAATPMAERALALRRLGTELRSQAPRLALLAALEMGKPVRQGRAEVEKCAWACDHYAVHAAAMLAPEAIETEAVRSYVRFDPLGVVLAIMPWNFPFWQVFRFAVPALAAGNVALLKHAPNVPRCALEIERLVSLAGVVEGGLQALFVSTQTTGELIAHPVVKAVTFTGSTRAGAEIAAQAGRALKKSVLELGGSDPFLVRADADIPAVARAATQARVQNAGQSCIAAKRFVVAHELADAFVEAFRRELEGLRVGDPQREETDVGPLAREDLLLTLDAQVRRSVDAGAKLVTGGRRLPGPGFFYAPTLLDGVAPGMPVADEETFGPVAAVMRVKDDEEAVAIANASEYGLGASVWSRDTHAAEALAARIESGSVFVNGMVKSDPRLPFGGIKHSGYGRELSVHGLREFVNVKTVWVGRPDA
ncbi:MAG TPA: succinate-semialdehyde dehydrogenase [Deltaproteobacteria bacterium]|jgi:succinate-semialdehyde dehydrogenase/glutarate-semialdehyde dehydrogenase|nr:succinate-semialdehyde dehydrogenase [Deltaproteobacteria bacterium]